MPLPIRIPALLLLGALAAAEDPRLPADVAAMHTEGKWKIRKADLYRYLVKYESRGSAALPVLQEYMKLRLVEDEAKRRKISVSDADVESKLAEIDALAKQQGQPGLDALRKQYEMRPQELKRKGRQWVLYERVARAVLKEKDPSRKDGPVGDDAVIFVIDTLYKDAPKETEGLPEGVAARIRGIDITEYEYGRALAIELPTTDVLRALRGLILAEEVALLLGDRNPPTPEEIATERRWFLDVEKNRLRRSVQDAPQEITDDIVLQVLASRGTSIDLVLSNPAFLAEARAVGHYERTIAEEDVRRFYDERQGQYGDQVMVARILVGARGQAVPGVGRQVRTLEQGKKEAQAIHEQLKGGQDFGKLARERSEDPDAIRKAGGIVPVWITADTPGYQDTFKQAIQLAKDQISPPFYSDGRGYVIVKLLEKRPRPDYAQIKGDVRSDAARYRYDVWRNERTRAAQVNTDLFEEK